ncbi:MAG: hypothetical protein EBS06_09075 [Proteobacteria bacterium]|nr:hypothetical protein [Pseudomonadota bacterium]
MACVRDTSNIPIALIAGDFTYKGLCLFKSGDSNLNLKLTQGNIINEKFDGHFWIEAGGLVIDPSIFRTLYSNHIPEALKSEIELRFGADKGCIIASPEEMISSSDFDYIPKYSLSDNTINGLIRGFFAHRAKQ